MEISGSPTSLGSLLSVFCFLLSPILDLCVAACLTLCSAKVMKSLLSSAVWHLYLSILHSSLPAHSEATLFQAPLLLPPLPPHPIVPTPHVFPSCMVVRVIFHFDGLCILPPLRASPLNCVLQWCQDLFWLWITSSFQSSINAFGNHLRQKMRASSSSKIVLAALAVL